LRALAERARARGVKLFLCAVDFEKAFDSVDRRLLWAALQRAGIGGSMLCTIQAMYADVPVCVKTSEGLSGCFQSVLGVKQGCPLSPLLFGIFLDDFEAYLQQRLGEAAALPTLAGRTVPPLLFADDMFLIATTAAGLQAQLHALQAYCDAKKLTVNTAKTQVMILRPGGGGGNGRLAAGEAFSYAGQPITVVSSVKYLGLTFSQLSKQRGFASCADVLAKAGRQAMFAMRRRAFELGACTVEQQCMLFDVFVKPVLSYGCSIMQQQHNAAESSTSSTNKFAYYLHHIRGDLPLVHPAPHLLQVTNSKHRIDLSRFRTSCHHLRIERERYLPKAIQAKPHDRTCLLCASPAVEDETHMVFHCPIYDSLRFAYADLFPPDLPMSIPCFLSQDQNRVAAFIHNCQVQRCKHACMSLAGSESAL